MLSRLSLPVENVLLIVLSVCLACIGSSRPEGDLLATDFASIQAALDALPEDGGIVTVPTGVYEIDKPIRITRSNVTLRGGGRGTVILNTNSDGEPAILAGGEKNHEKNILWGVTVSNLCITGDQAAAAEARAWPTGEEEAVTSGDAILADHCYNSLFEKLWLVRNGGNGLNLHICLEDPRVVSCVISYNRRAGLRIEGAHDLVVASSHFEENYEEGMLALDSWNIAASGNDFDDNRKSAVVLKGCIGCPLSGNLYTNSPEWGLVLENCRGNTLNGEIIRRNLARGGLLLKNSSYNTVSGCSFDSNDGAALALEGDSRHNSITGNVLSSFQVQDKVTGFKIGGSGNLLSANVISPGSGFALVLSGSDQQVYGNSFLLENIEAKFIRLENPEWTVLRDNLFRRSGRIVAREKAIIRADQNN